MARPSTVLRGKVAVVTGSTRGIGLMIAAAFAQAGAQLVLCGRTMAGVEAAYHQFEAVPGVEVLGVACDVRRHAEVEALAAQALARFGALDIWVNNAALAGPRAPTAEMPPEAWQAVLETNLLGTFHGTQVALLHMLPRSAGKIITLVDPEASAGKVPPAGLAAYAASKAGVLRFMQSVAAEYQHTPLSLLMLAPGSPATTLFPPDPLTPAPRRPPTELTEIGEWAVRLASRETDGITGRLYEVEQGLGKTLRGLWRG